jgi:hypothetical protein
MTAHTSTRVDLALLGFRGRPPVSRTAGAGPSADGHLVIDGLNAAIPQNADSPLGHRAGRRGGQPAQVL